MAPKRKKANLGTSPVVRSAEKVKKKHRKPTSPRKDKKIRTRRALYDVQVKKVSIHKASVEHDLSYSYLYRRVSGETAIDSKNGPETVFSTQEEKELAELPDHLTSPEYIRKLEHKNLDNIRKFARKEKKAKQAYLKNKKYL